MIEHSIQPSSSLYAQNQLEFIEQISEQAKKKNMSSGIPLNIISCC